MFFFSIRRPSYGPKSEINTQPTIINWIEWREDTETWSDLDERTVRGAECGGQRVSCEIPFGCDRGSSGSDCSESAGARGDNNQVNQAVAMLYEINKSRADRPAGGSRAAEHRAPRTPPSLRGWVSVRLPRDAAWLSTGEKMQEDAFSAHLPINTHL